ncbi:AbrB/MazE/SpoVT family DNA-binding domain-containing protein [Marinobacterium nitratireducens]|nr:AbrB/MazE/SpoVT family DNA-binding domain-containing protein [Marinobacterium nitratireducens]
MRTEIKRWGDSAAVRIPSKLLAAAHLDVSSELSLTVQEGKIVIEAAPEKTKKRLQLPFSEAQLLKGLTADTGER